MTRDRITSAVARRDAMRNELLNPVNEQLRPTTLERAPRQAAGATDMAGPAAGKRARGSRSAVNRPPGAADHPAVTRQGAPSRENPVASDLPVDKGVTPAGAGAPPASVRGERVGRPSRQMSQQGRALRLESAKEATATNNSALQQPPSRHQVRSLRWERPM